MTDTSRHNSHPTVVVAEDHEDSRLLFKTFLESKGCRVVEAADGLLPSSASAPTSS